MDHQSYEAELSAILAMMAATLKGASQDKASLGQAWLMVVRPRVEMEWLTPTCQWFLLHAIFFPTPSEFIDKANDIRDRAKMQIRLDATRDELKAMAAAGIEDPRWKNLEGLKSLGDGS